MTVEHTSVGPTLAIPIRFFMCHEHSRHVRLSSSCHVGAYTAAETAHAPGEANLVSHPGSMIAWYIHETDKVQACSIHVVSPIFSSIPRARSARLIRQVSADGMHGKYSSMWGE